MLNQIIIGLVCKSIIPFPIPWGVNFTLKIDKSTKKNPINKNQGWEPIHQKQKANENTSRHNLKKKQNQTINKNQVKTL